MTPHRLYVGTIGEGMFRSLDSGETFRRACEGMFVECHVRALVADPRDSRLLYLGSEQGLFRSRDGADSWERVDSPLNGLQIWSILLLPANPDILLVGTCPARLFRSADGGKTWSEPTVSMTPDCPRIMHTRVTTLLADHGENNTVWAGVEIDGVWRSKDTGKTWERVGTGLSSQDIHSLLIVPQTGTFLAATNNDLNASSDRGETWQPLNLGGQLPFSYCRTLTRLHGNRSRLLLGIGDGPPGSTGRIASSSDGGKTWQLARLPGEANSTIWNFAVHPASPDLVYASSVSGEVYRSTDAGDSWVKLAREFGEVRALCWST